MRLGPAAWQHPEVLRIATVNVNGLRAAARKGLHDWVAECAPDIVTLQIGRAHV